MLDEKLSAEDVAAYRRRVEYEDGLLNSRTNTVLTLNGLGAIAIGLPLSYGSHVSLVLVVIIIDALWLYCAFEASRFITAFKKEIKAAGDIAPADERFRYEIFGEHYRLSPTKYVAIIIPALLLTGWLFGVLYDLLAL